MSFDLMVFDPGVAPHGEPEFMQWYDQQTEWGEPHQYDDPAVSAPALQLWFAEMLQTFPAMNGPHANPDEVDDEDYETDYSIGAHMIYAGFSWDVAEEASVTARALAEKHKVGFYDLSREAGERYIPK